MARRSAIVLNAVSALTILQERVQYPARWTEGTFHHVVGKRRSARQLEGQSARNGLRSRSPFAWPSAPRPRSSTSIRQGFLVREEALLGRDMVLPSSPSPRGTLDILRTGSEPNSARL